jgi:hypothetical protein
VGERPPCGAHCRCRSSSSPASTGAPRWTSRSCFDGGGGGKCERKHSLRHFYHIGNTSRPPTTENRCFFWVYRVRCG